MTRKYERVEPTLGTIVEERFRDSQFLVLMNRFLAFLIAGTYILSTRQPTHYAPVLQYALASLSNIFSSWCQYEALNFISFPTQVLGKACKVIPVMLMSLVVQRKSYPCHQYVTAIMVSLGMFLWVV